MREYLKLVSDTLNKAQVWMQIFMENGFIKRAEWTLPPSLCVCLCMYHHLQVCVCVWAPPIVKGRDTKRKDRRGLEKEVQGCRFLCSCPTCWCKVKTSLSRSDFRPLETSSALPSLPVCLRYGYIIRIRRSFTLTRQISKYLLKTSKLPRSLERDLRGRIWLASQRIKGEFLCVYKGLGQL